MCFNRDRDRQLLDRQLFRPVHLDQLAWLREQMQELRNAKTWGAAAELLGTPLPDRALRPILHSAARDGYESWNSVVLRLFWPSLSVIYRTRRRWGDGTDAEFWSDVVASFWLAVARLDLERRGDRLAAKVFGDTVHNTYARCRRNWRLARTERLALSDRDAARLHLRGLANPASVRAAEDVAAEDEGVRDWRCDRESRRRHYLTLLRNGAIDADEYLLLCGTRLFGWTARTCGCRLGLTRDAAKKRLQRVEARIRHLDPLCCPSRVPTLGGRGPS